MPESAPNQDGKQGNWQENYEKVITATEVPQPSRYTIQIKGHQYCLTKNECLRLHQALLKVLPYEKTTDIDTIKIAVSRVLRISVREIESQCRKEHIAEARHAAMWLARKLNMTLVEIAEGFLKHHCTVIHALKAFERKLETQPKLKAKIDKLESELKELLE